MYIVALKRVYTIFLYCTLTSLVGCNIQSNESATLPIKKNPEPIILSSQETLPDSCLAYIKHYRAWIAEYEKSTRMNPTDPSKEQELMQLYQRLVQQGKNLEMPIQCEDLSAFRDSVVKITEKVNHLFDSQAFLKKQKYQSQ